MAIAADMANSRRYKYLNLRAEGAAVRLFGC